MPGAGKALTMTAAIPGIVVSVGVVVGMVVGSYFGQITLGAFLGAGRGFFVGLALLMRVRKKPR